jgi:hypothetical protein
VTTRVAVSAEALRRPGVDVLVPVAGAVAALSSGFWIVRGFEVTPEASCVDEFTNAGCDQGQPRDQHHRCDHRSHRDGVNAEGDSPNQRGQHDARPTEQKEQRRQPFEQVIRSGHDLELAATPQRCRVPVGAVGMAHAGLAQRRDRQQRLGVVRPDAVLDPPRSQVAVDPLARWPVLFRPWRGCRR